MVPVHKDSVIINLDAVTTAAFRTPPQQMLIVFSTGPCIADCIVTVSTS